MLVVVLRHLLIELRYDGCVIKFVDVLFCFFFLARFYKNYTTALFRTRIELIIKNVSFRFVFYLFFYFFFYFFLFFFIFFLFFFLFFFNMLNELIFYDMNSLFIDFYLYFSFTNYVVFIFLLSLFYVYVSVCFCFCFYFTLLKVIKFHWLHFFF